MKAPTCGSLLGQDWCSGDKRLFRKIMVVKSIGTKTSNVYTNVRSIGLSYDDWLYHVIHLIVIVINSLIDPLWPFRMHPSCFCSFNTTTYICINSNTCLYTAILFKPTCWTYNLHHTVVLVKLPWQSTWVIPSAMICGIVNGNVLKIKTILPLPAAAYIHKLDLQSKVLS